MESDLDIARSIELAPIEEIAWKMGIGVEELIPFGRHMAKVTWPAIRNRLDRPRGSLVLVTSVNPTRYGEGKTVTTIGLSMGLNRIGKKSACVIREPSMGPVFGIKGGAAGGGHVQVLPMEDINLHFTGDLHAVTSAHNLCSAILDNHLHHGNKLEIDTSRLLWPRVIDMNDRTLRGAAIGLGGPGNGVTREERFDITAASEVMAILALSTDYEDLRKRLGNIVVGSTSDGKPVKAEDIGSAGTMALLMRTAFLPNLVQTTEGTPAFIHAGPFANIAHGNSSIIADRLALSIHDIVVTEAGFGADLGAEKALHIKTNASGLAPDCIVVNVTVRSMKMHGLGMVGLPNGKEALIDENVEMVRHGASANLSRHIQNMARFGPDVVVSINKFPTDSEAEILALMEIAKEAGAADVALYEGHSKGGVGAEDLAKSVSKAVQRHMAAGRPFNPLFETNAPVVEKIENIAKTMYGASGISIKPRAKKQLEKIKEWGYGELPVCMAKTQYSFSHDPAQYGAPKGFTLPVREFRLNAGAGFIVAVCGDMMTMPGLPKIPAAKGMDMDKDGNLTGIFS
ncbi:MAG: formate--tetrahydrofolate ligase [Euryarchaeota archaeon]|nr:formate--tetrahydrofolate ligase [Euryarchaeota archaeon]